MSRLEILRLLIKTFFHSSRRATRNSILDFKCKSNAELYLSCRARTFSLSSELPLKDETMASHVHVMEWKDRRVAIMGQERASWSRFL